jgi:hypothetical protein
MPAQLVIRTQLGRGVQLESTAGSLGGRIRVMPSIPITSEAPGVRPAISGACARSLERSRPASVPGNALASAWSQ